MYIMTILITKSFIICDVINNNSTVYICKHRDTFRQSRFKKTIFMLCTFKRQNKMKETATVA